MSLKDQISDDIKAAMKAKDKIRLETVRSIKKVILERESSLRADGIDSLTDEQEIEILTQQAKQRREAIAQYRQAGREELAAQEEQELDIIESYLPKQLTDEELSAALDAIISQVGASSPKDMGKVMGSAMKQFKGKAEGNKVQAMVKEKLSN
ncbi:MAG: GatB/YqeY domain-containing protein [Elainellaceae cyanobacterium]